MGTHLPTGAGRNKDTETEKQGHAERRRSRRREEPKGRTKRETQKGPRRRQAWSCSGGVGGVWPLPSGATEKGQDPLAVL